MPVAPKLGAIKRNLMGKPIESLYVDLKNSVGSRTIPAVFCSTLKYFRFWDNQLNLKPPKN